MKREGLYLFGIFACIILSVPLMIYVVSNVVGLTIMLAIAAALGYAADSFYPSPYDNGRYGAMALGLLGALVGQALLGKFGPSIAGVVLIPAFLGALAINAALHYKIRLDRAKALEVYQAQATGDPLLMAILEQYRIIRFLGAGAFSRVYKAVPNRSLNEKLGVAVKVFTDNAIQSEGFIGRMQRESQLCQKLQHPNIVRVIHAGEQNNLHYLLMEFVEGETLAKRLERGTASIQETLDLLIALGEALAYAHGQGVIHRDIKPENILMCPDGQPKIMDFGLARLEGTSTLTQSGSAVGTPHYMAPEQILEEKILDGRCDQYALGVMAFELLTGERVFEGDQAVIILMKHINEAPRDPRSLRETIPQELADVVLRMLSKKRDDRFPNTEAVVQVLIDIRDNLHTLLALSDNRQADLVLAKQVASAPAPGRLPESGKPEAPPSSPVRLKPAGPARPAAAPAPLRRPGSDQTPR